MNDILILCHSKDINKLKYLMPSIDLLRDTNDIGQIHIVSNEPNRIKFNNTIVHDDRDIFPDVNFNFRSNWIRQQLVKLTQVVTSDRYINIDADIVFTKPVSFFNNGYPTFLLKDSQLHPPYFNFMQLLGLRKQTEYSFINEVMVFERNKIKEMFASFKMDCRSFIDFCKQTITHRCYLSEFELYGNWIAANCPENYWYQKVKVSSLGKYGMWADTDIESSITIAKANGCDWLTVHTWT